MAGGFLDDKQTKLFPLCKMRLKEVLELNTSNCYRFTKLFLQDLTGK